MKKFQRLGYVQQKPSKLIFKHLIMKRFLFLSALVGFVFYEYVAARPVKAGERVQGEFSFSVKESIDHDPIFDKIVRNNKKFKFDILFGGYKPVDVGNNLFLEVAAGFTGVEFTTNYDAEEVSADAPAIIDFAHFVNRAGIKFNGSVVMDADSNNMISDDEIRTAAMIGKCVLRAFNPCSIFLPFHTVNNPFADNITDQRIATVGLTSKITKDRGVPDVWLDGTKWTINGQDFQPANNIPQNTEFEIQPVPGPLPLLGLGAAFGYSRKLRKRLNISKSPKDTSIN